jgi:hypothetical protein
MQDPGKHGRTRHAGALEKEQQDDRNLAADPDQTRGLAAARQHQGQQHYRQNGERETVETKPREPVHPVAFAANWAESLRSRKAADLAKPPFTASCR